MSKGNIWINGSKLYNSNLLSCLIHYFASSLPGCSLSLWLTGNWQEELELWRKLILGVESVGEVDSSNSAVSMNLNSKGLYVVGSVSSSCEIGQVELNLIPTLIKSHGHGANKWLDSGGGLVVGGSESTSNALVIKDLYLKSEVLLQVLNDHD